MTIHYTLDPSTGSGQALAAGLTQVLADNNHTYLYGLGRISQHTSTQTEYFLGDALGSLRQLVDGNGNVTLTKSYTPYGETLSSVGSGSSMFAYTGEATDSSGLVYLRARYYAPGQGRFITKDFWQGVIWSPETIKGYNYASSNPINFIDPSGLVDCSPWPSAIKWMCEQAESGNLDTIETLYRTIVLYANLRSFIAVHSLKNLAKSRIT